MPLFGDFICPAVCLYLLTLPSFYRDVTIPRPVFQDFAVFPDLQIDVIGPLVKQEIENAGHNKQKEENKGKTAIGTFVPGQLCCRLRLADDSSALVDVP